MTYVDIIGWLLIEAGALAIITALTIKDRQVIITE
jgi:hypothetical protein